MIRAWLLAAVACTAFGAEPAVYEISGRMVPRMGRYVSLSGVSLPYSEATLADVSGRFKFKKLAAGTYTLSILNRQGGELRRTVEVGPAAADRKRRVTLTLRLRESDFESAATAGSNVVSVHQLAVPASALRDYRDAQKDLSKQEPDSASKRLEHAVEVDPQFSAAWNGLGVIAYQSQKYDRAEECFREAVKQDPQSFEALVNLGGVLVTQRKLDEAADYNLKAVLARPNDALANAQLGMTYFSLHQDDLAVKYLVQARNIDPAHFSHPQLLLFEIHLRHGQRAAAADDLEDFLRRHPDWQQAARLRQAITSLRAAAP